MESSTLIKKNKIAIIGLGYVGLPLAVEFGKQYKVVGFDIDVNRIDELKECFDRTHEIECNEIAEARGLTFSSNVDDIREASIYIITVPTPIDESNRPNLQPLIAASKTVGSVLSKGDIVVYESTVYPGATEEDCVPILVKVSGLRFNEDFFCGYSPERINPGDKNNKLKDIVKVTSGSNEQVAEFIDKLYGSIITAGTYRAESIKVAEAAKVIENTQRDLNIALINEFSLLFNKLEIDTFSVLKAAGTKWNFLPFRPGLVGGHCIGVDPYYLTHKAQSVGYNPEIILAGRRLNDGMAKNVANNLVKAIAKRGIELQGAKVLVMGITFKENCPDIRNSKVVDLVHELESYNIQVDVTDPCCSPSDVLAKIGLELTQEYQENKYDGIIIAVGHDDFKKLGIETIRKLGKAQHILYDLKYLFEHDLVDMRL